jgi:hypothetical protein
MSTIRHKIILEKDGKEGIKDVTNWSWLDTEIFISEMKNQGFTVTMREEKEEKQ